MSNRLDYVAAAPKAVGILLEQEKYLRRQFTDNHALPLNTWGLVKLRVSQINQCAYCIDMHTKDALKLGEKFERIIGLSAWPDMPFYSDSEQCALAWAEHLTAAKPVTEAQYQRALDSFGDEGLVDLTIAINAINSWNRVAKAFKPEVGSYQPD